MYGIELNPNENQYVVMLTYDNSDYKAIVGGVHKVLKNAQKKCADANAEVMKAKEHKRQFSALFPESDEEWSHRVYKVLKLTYEEVIK